MARYSCPVCGDPNAYPIWIDKEPPLGCPDGDEIKTVLECPTQMTRARQQACWRRVCPNSFDAMGIIKPGHLGLVINAVVDAGYNPFTGFLEKNHHRTKAAKESG